jgi:peptidoglycan/LPS O-acetylase OafA/YrhL
MASTSQASVQVRFGDSVVLPPGAFRLVLAAAVVVSHVSHFDIGRLAVLLFFYLSGYWTARIWSEKFAGSDALRFYAARYLRIAPLYLLAMVSAALLRGLPVHVENLTLFGVASTGRDPTGVSWSLDVELQFYMLLPFVAAFIASAPGWASTVLALGVGALGCWLGAHYGLITVLKYLPAFAFGSMTYAKAWKPSLKASHLSLLAFAAMTVFTAFTPFLDKRKLAPFDEDIWSFFWMLPLLPYVARSLTVRSTKLDRHLGNLSYPLYLTHFATIAVLHTRFGDAATVKLLAIGLSCVVALCAYVLLDRPIDHWRVQLTERTKS